MRFLVRALAGLGLFLSTLALTAAAGWHLYDTITTAQSRKRPPARERLYAVDAGTLKSQSITPKISAFGKVQTWNSLEIRAPAAGPVTEISPNFRDGMSVKAGELLFRIDPELAERRVVDARAALAQAQTEQDEASATQKHLEAELQAARAEEGLRRADLARQKQLYAKKLTTSTVRDDAVLAVSAAEQSVIAKEREILALKARIEKAIAGVERAVLTLSDAERALKDTSYRAPFSGRLNEVALTLGRRVAQTEKLGLLIDPLSLEVSFPLRNDEFGRLVKSDDRDKLAPLPVTVTLDLAENDVVATAVLERPAAVASTQAGRTVFARITGGEAAALRPGDFVSVSVAEPKIENVAVISADAATLDGRILIIGAGDRLEEQKVRIVRRQGEKIVVADVPFGARFVERRLPFLARGLKVKPKNVKENDSTSSPVASANTDAAPRTTAQKSFDESRRAALIAYVKGRKKMPERIRTKLLKELSKTEPENYIVKRIERHMARKEDRS